MKCKPLIRPAVIVLFFVEIFLSLLAECKNLYLRAELGRSDISQNAEEDIGIYRVKESATALRLVIGNEASRSSSLEGRYSNLGEIDANLGISIAQVDGFESAVISQLPLNDRDVL